MYKMQLFKFFFHLFWLGTLSCQTTEKSVETSYPRMIGDSEFDLALDSPDFVLCHTERSVIQYYAIGEKTYSGEKRAIIESFEKSYDPAIVKKESGLIRIRFIVNCNGNTGRFRINGMDPSYNEKVFDPKITNQLLEITKSLKDWKIYPDGDKRKRDYYMYLTFKIVDGQIKEILP